MSNTGIFFEWLVILAVLNIKLYFPWNFIFYIENSIFTFISFNVDERHWSTHLYLVPSNDEH